MTVDWVLADLRLRMFTRLSHVTDASLLKWRPEITDGALRHGILSNSRLESKILAEILEMQGPDNETANHAIPDSEALKFLLDADVDKLVRRVGLAWHSDQIALLVMRGELKQYLGGVGLDDIRQALTLRDRSRAPTVRSEDLSGAISKSGRECLSAWLNNLARPVGTMFRLFNGALGEIYRESCRSQDMACIVTACLQQTKAPA